MSDHTTRKSFKTQARDKPKHSSKDITVAKKGGAGGRGTWGAEKDDVKYMGEDMHAYGEDDPNFDPNGADLAAESADFPKQMSKIRVEGNGYVPSMTDLTTYKGMVRDALTEYLVSHERAEFLECVKDPKYTLFHQDLPAVLIKSALDKSDGDRLKISELLQALHKDNTVTSSQMAQGFRKLYNVMEELVVDAPNAKVIMSEFVGHGHAGGYLDGKDTAEMEEDTAVLANFPALKGTKAKINSNCTEYLATGELSEFTRGVAQRPRAMQYEVIKQLVTLSLDHSDQQRENASRAIAALVGSTVRVDQAVKGFTLLLNRCEDLALDVPDVPRMLALMLARAIADEALPPSFLLRLDLSPDDQGFQVANQARSMLNQPRSAEMLAGVWGA